MIRLNVPYRNNLNIRMIEKAEDFEIIHTSDYADFILCQSTVANKNQLGKTIYVAAITTPATARTF